MRQIDRLHRLMVIVEGPTGVGKTTLAAALRRAHDQQLWVVESLAGFAYVNDDAVNRPFEDRRSYLAELGLLERGFDVRQVVLYAMPLRIVNRRHAHANETLPLIERTKQEVAAYQRWAGLSKRFVATLEVWNNENDPAVGELTAHVTNWLEQQTEVKGV